MESQAKTKKGGSGGGGEQHFKTFSPGQVVWIRNDDFDDNVQDNSQRPFYQAEVIEDRNDSICCKLTKKELETCEEPKFKSGSITWKKIHVMETSAQSEAGIKDMIDIDELNHATVLYNLYSRYSRDEIYTYVGPTLLAVNPFKYLTAKTPEDYKVITNAGSNYLEVMQSLDPHTYAVTAFAHKQMIATSTRQGIVISGESGAGKTESARQCMAYLTSLGSRPDPDAPQDGRSVGDRILDTNPVLEAFGNSKTARNNNSSRFGKYIKIFFDTRTGLVAGAEIQNYLLEKSRVIGCTPKERNYHIYFFMFRGMEKERLKKYGMLRPDGNRCSFEDFVSTSVGSDIPNGETKDLNEWNDLAKAFNTLGFTEEEQDCIFRITAASLYLGDIKIDASTFKEGSTAVSLQPMDKMKHIADMLMVDVNALITELVNKEAVAGVSARTPWKPDEAMTSIQSLAKGLFDNMFNWLVNKMNLLILPKELKSGN